LKRFVDRVRGGEVPPGSYLLVESLDRLSREEVLDALEFFLTLMRLGLTVVTIGDAERAYSRETLREDNTQLLTSIIVMMRAHEESATKSDRVGRAWAAKRDRARTSGQAMTARCPAWLLLVDGPKVGHYELIEERAALIRGWFAKTIDGIGRRAIARQMNALGLPTWGKGALWHDSYVQKVLSNPATYGVFVPLGKLAGGHAEAPEEIPNYFPAVVDEATFRKAQASSRERGSGAGSTSPKNWNVLRGLAKCEVCGANMIFIDKGKRSRGAALKCGSAHQGAGCDHRQLYGFRPIEISVIFALGAKRASLSASALDAQKTADDALTLATARRDEKKAAHDRLVDLHVNGVASLLERLKQSSDELSALEKEVAEAEAALDRAKLSEPDVDVADIGRIYDDLSRLTPDERVAARAAMREKLGRLVEKVVIGPSGTVTHLRDGSRGFAVRAGGRGPIREKQR